jgi:hypothetical protein
MWGAGCSYSSCWCNSLGWQRLRTACRYGWKETATARHPACCLAETALYAELERHQDFLAERGIIVSHETSRPMGDLHWPDLCASPTGHVPDTDRTMAS